jgi:hypothetical protein
VDHDIEAAAQAGAQPCACFLPSLLEPIARDRYIGNGQVQPVHLLPPDFVAK